MTQLRDVYPVHLETTSEDSDLVVREALQKLWRSGDVSAGDRVIVTMGDQTGKSGGTNSLRLVRLDAEGYFEFQTTLDLESGDSAGAAPDSG